MKRIAFLMSIIMLYWLSIYGQDLSLAVNCSTPGQLSSLIDYETQITVHDLKVTGYINGIDLNFIKSLNKNRSLKGVINLKDVEIIADGSIIKTDNVLPDKCFAHLNDIQKLIMPYSIIAMGFHTFAYTRVDSLLFTGPINKVDIGVFDSSVDWPGTSANQPLRYVYISEGTKRIDFGYFFGNTNYIENRELHFPSTIEKITFGRAANNDDLIIYSDIPNPSAIDFSYNSSSPGGFEKGTIFVPIGTKELYETSEFRKLNIIENIPVQSISFNTDNLNLHVGESFLLDAKVYPVNAAHQDVQYVLSDTTKANIEDGYLVAISTGSLEVIAFSHDKLFSDTCFVNIYSHTTGISMQNEVSLKINETKNLFAKTLPLEDSDQQISYQCDDSDIAIVDKDGNIRGRKKGTCVITATTVDGGYEAQCLVTVIQPVEAISLDKHSLSIKVGESESLHYNILPTNADNKKVLWSANDTTIATVDNNGIVTGKKSGNTVIKVVSEDNLEVSDSCVVKVTQPVTGITLDHTTGTIYGIGNKLLLTATVLPEDASNKDVNWTSSDQSVCFVSNGEVIGLSFGTSVIIATTVDGGFPATCVVNVKQARGDVNGDGSVNVTDVTALVNMILGVISKDMERADINGDGKINVTDVTSLVNIILGIK